MTLKLKSVLSVGFILPLFFVGTVFAQVQKTDNDPAKDEKLLERLETRKKNMENRLTAAQIQQVKGQCSSAQGKIKVVQGRLNGKASERATQYARALENISRLSAKLKTKEYDTSTLDQQITELKAAIDSYTNGFNEFREQINDLENMDCESDPEAFKATLIDARLKRDEIVNAATEAKELFTTKLRPTMLTIRESIANKAGSASAGGEN